MGSEDKNAIMLNCSTTTNSIQKSVTDYYKRMTEFQENLAKEIKQKNTDQLQKMIGGINLGDTNDLSKLNYANGDIQSIFKFAHYNNFDTKALSDVMYRLGKQQKTVEEKIQKLQKGESDPSSVKVDTGLQKNDLGGNRDLIG